MGRKATTGSDRYEPDYAVPPGATLLEKIRELGMTQKDLAMRLGLSEKHVSQIVNGKEPITQKTAIGLERATGIPAHFWNSREMIYRERLARKEDAERLRKGLEILKDLPTKELVKRGVLSASRDREAMLQEVLAFFGASSADALRQVWQGQQAAARRSQAFKSQPGATATWLRLGELAASRIECKEYCRPKFQRAVRQIRSLTAKPAEEFTSGVQRLCATAGVATVFVPEITGAPLYGASWWLTPRKACIELNLRGRKDDQFWFSFFHEAGHVLHDGKLDVYINDGSEEDSLERKANQFAGDLLIPPEWIDRLRALNSRAGVKRLARELGIAPGIVVGRYQRETGRYSWFNDLKRTFAWSNG